MRLGIVSDTHLPRGNRALPDDCLERLAALRAQPSGVTVTNVVAINTTANIAAYERQIAALEAGSNPAPDETGPDGPDTLQLLLLRERPRR
jgi:hypothetical protein